MRSGGGKIKGAEFERSVCKALSLWISSGKDEGLFWRSAMSGGRSTVAHAKGKHLATQAGDISAVGEAGMPFIATYVVECKTYKTLDYHGLVTGKGKLVEFWHAVRAEAVRYDKLPILIARQNQHKTIVCLDKYGLSRLLSFRASLTLPHLDMNIVLFDEFLKTAKVPK